MKFFDFKSYMLFFLFARDGVHAGTFGLPSRIIRLNDRNSEVLIMEMVFNTASRKVELTTSNVVKCEPRGGFATG